MVAKLAFEEFRPNVEFCNHLIVNMNTNCFVTVVIPVRNGEKTLRRCLRSVINQNYAGDYEIVVVDNNSTDGTKEIIKKFQKVDKRIKYHFQEKIGRGAARRCGILNAKGQIIIMTDSDCIAPGGWIEKMTQPIIAEDEKAVMGSEREASGNYWSKNIQKANADFYKHLIAGRHINHIDTKNFAARRELMERIIFDENLKSMEDLDFFLRLKEFSKIRFLSEVKVSHFHKDSFVKYAALQISRGYWAHKIYKKHKKNNVENVKNIAMFQGFSTANNLLFIFFLLKILLCRPKEFPFRLTQEIFWRVGMIRSIFFEADA